MAKPSETIKRLELGSAYGRDKDVSVAINAIIDHLDAEYEAKQKAEPRWRAKRGEQYWALDSGFDVECDIECDIETPSGEIGRIDDDRLAYGKIRGDNRGV